MPSTLPTTASELLSGCNMGARRLPECQASSIGAVDVKHLPYVNEYLSTATAGLVQLPSNHGCAYHETAMAG